jgi:hypothetical protein
MDRLLTTQDIMPVVGAAVFFICVTLIALGCTLAVQWRKARQAEFECDLKREMIGRGMSADDILKVLQATSTASHEKDVTTLLARLQYDPDDIIRILQASSKPRQPPQSA